MCAIIPPCAAALRDVDIVFNAAAMKQVPTCEYSPSEAMMTNLKGAENIVRAIRDLRLPVDTVVGVSTDKAVKPVNVMGMTKALQERIFTSASLHCPIPASSSCATATSSPPGVLSFHCSITRFEAAAR